MANNKQSAEIELTSVQWPIGCCPGDRVKVYGEITFYLNHNPPNKKPDWKPAGAFNGVVGRKAKKHPGCP